MEFTIYRDSWRRGGKQHDFAKGTTCLLNAASSMMCCLGQVAAQAGIPLPALYNKAMPEDLPNDYADGVEACSIGYDSDSVTDTVFTLRNSKLADLCVDINDNPNFTEGQREQSLINAFADDSEHVLRFVDGVAPWLVTA